jgi:hypothetical protein
VAVISIDAALIASTSPARVVVRIAFSADANGIVDADGIAVI